MAFRRERTQLTELIERSKEVLRPLGYHWHEQDKYFRGPKGGRLRFSYLENDSDADGYQGHSYTRLYPEEMGTFPSESPINKLQATLRSGNGVPCQMKGTCNPGGPGHQWVKARYRLGEYPNGFEVFRYEFTNPFTKSKIERTRVFIPSKVSDNKFLGDDYVAGLYQVGSENLVRAWLLGDWSVIEGAFFDGWSPARHIVAPFHIPDNWVRIRAMDWGYAKPFSVGWWAVAADPMTLPSGQIIPRGCMVCYREWYGKASANVGLRIDAEEVAAGIKDRETGEKMDNAVLDPSAFAQNGGPSLAERMYTSHKIGFRAADNTRVGKLGAVSGWDGMRARLRGDEDGNPMIVFFSTCTDSIRTIPALQHDTLRAEDIDTDGEDHCFAAGTLVDTDCGPVPIEEVTVGKHAIWSGGEWRRNFWPRMTRVRAPTIKLTFENGVQIVCTPDHRFMDFTGEWRYARDLKGVVTACDQSLSARPSRNLMASAITAAASTFRSAVSAFTGKYGRPITGQSQKALTSTIRMKIDPTMRPTTWSALRCRSIWAAHMAKQAVYALNNIFLPPRTQPLFGMVPPLASNGTQSILSDTFGRSLLREFPQFAPTVAANTLSQPLNRNRESFAEITVEPVRCVNVEEMPARPVYCLSEPITQAFTIHGGMIVHNCADQVRYACNSRPWVRQSVPAKKPVTQQNMTMNDLWRARARDDAA